MNARDVMNRLVAADPVQDDELRGWVLSAEGRSVLDEVVAQRCPAPARPRKARFAARSAAVAASALLLFAGGAALRRNEPAPRDRPVVTGGPRDVLHGAALAAARSNQVTAGPGQFLYRKFQGQGTGTQDVDGRQITAFIPTTIEVWISHDDGSGRILGDVRGPRFTTAEDEAWWRAAGSPAFADVGTFEKALPSSDYPREDLSSYPTGVDELYAYLADKAEASAACPPASSGDAQPCPAEGDKDVAVFTSAADLLLTYPDATPELRAALFEVLSRVPGTRTTREAEDPRGRPAAMTSIAVGEDGGRSQRHEIYFDHRNAEMLGFRDVFTRPDGSEITYAYSVLVDWGVVDAPPERP